MTKTKTVLKNRIVGMVIVVALAIIILPELFKNAGQQNQESFQETPLRPHIESEMTHADFPEDFTHKEEAAEPEDIDELLEILDDGDTFKEKALKEAPLKTSEKTTNTTGASRDTAEDFSEQWVIQIGVFREKKRAEKLVEELKSYKYPAYIRLVSGAQGPLHYVFVGPELDKSILAQQLEQLQQVLGEKVVIKAYRPAAQ